MTRPRIAFLVSHPIQYYAPIFRALAEICDLKVYFAHRQTAEGQAKAGFGIAFEWDVDILSGYDSTFLENVSRKPSTDTFFGCDTPGIGAALDAGRFDTLVVPGWALRCYWQAVMAARRRGIACLVRGDSQLEDRRSLALRLAKRLVYGAMLSRFDGYLFVGRRNRDYLAHYGAAADRLFFSPHCIDNAAFAAASDAARPAAPRPDRPRRVLFVGKLIPRKRPLEVLEACAAVNASVGPLEVVFAGSGELEPELRRAASGAGVPVEFLGFVNQSQLPAAYASADLLVLPSSQETWGLVVNEAMACGLPAVVSDMVGCGPDLVDPGATGAVFPLGDVAAFGRAIAEVLRLDPAASRVRLAEKMAVYSPRRAAQGIVDAAVALAAARRSE